MAFVSSEEVKLRDLWRCKGILTLLSLKPPGLPPPQATQVGMGGGIGL